jgi:hypothetical protein
MRREPAKPLILCTAWTPETTMDGIPTNYEPVGQVSNPSGRTRKFGLALPARAEPSF